MAVETSRGYYDQAKNKYRAWRKWPACWRWGNSILGMTSITVGSIVAAYTSSNPDDPVRQLIGTKTAAVLAILAPVLTFLLTALTPQAQAAAFETASRSWRRL